MSLAELGVDSERPGALPALEEAWGQVRGWLLAPQHVAGVPLIDGRYRRCGSQEGNALWAASVMRLGTDAERSRLASNLLRWQWPDGGWNCDRHPSASHSSFNESLPPLRGLVAHRAAVGASADGASADGASAAVASLDLDAAIERAAEFFLRHGVIESERTGQIAHPRFLELAWPPYWHYGLLPGLRGLAEAGRLDDPRAGRALDRLAALRGPDGSWRPTRRYWRRGRTGTGTEILSWGAAGEAWFLARQSREVLAAAGRAT